jgi:TIR domain
MRYIVGQILAGGRIIWEDMGSRDDARGVTITFSMHGQVSLQRAQNELTALLSQNQVEWLRPSSQNLWLFRSQMFKDQFPDFFNEAWLQGDVLIPMDRDVQRRHNEDFTYCRFVVTPDVIEDQMPKKVFLSHKGVDKPMVRRYKDALESVGIAAWLDEDAMTAGVELERGISDGFEQSSAAVFFVTESFRDEGFLATEIEYARREKRKKGKRFSIITLLLDDAAQVPPLLSSPMFGRNRDRTSRFYGDCACVTYQTWTTILEIGFVRSKRRSHEPTRTLPDRARNAALLKCLVPPSIAFSKRLRAMRIL